MAGPDDKVTSYRRPHEGAPTGTATDVPREALGRVDLPVVGPLDLELALGRPLRLTLDADVLELEPGGALLARLPELPTVEVRRARLDLVQGTVTADAEAIGPFILAASGVGARIAMRRGLAWQPGRSVLDLLAQNLPQDPRSGARRLWSGPLGAAAWVRVDARLTLELRGDRAEATLSHAAVLRVLGVALPVLAIRLLFGSARLEIDPGPTGPVRRAILRLAAWIASRWLRARLPAAMVIPGYDLFADEQRRTRLLDLVRRLRGRPRPRRFAKERGHVQEGMSHPTENSGHVQQNMSNQTSFKNRLAALIPTTFTAARPPAGARVLARIPLGERGELALLAGREHDIVITRSLAGARLDGRLSLHADELPELAELRLVRVLLHAADEPRLDIQTDPPLGPLMRALARRLTDTQLVPKLPPDLLRRLGFTRARADDQLVLLHQPFSATAGIELRTDPGAEVRLRHGAEALVIEAPAGLQVRFSGLPYLPDAVIRRLAYRWHDGSLTADATPDLGEFGALALGQIVRVRAAPVLPDILGLRRDGGPELDPRLEEQLPHLAVSTGIPVLGRLEVRFDPDDTLAVGLSPQALTVTSPRRIGVVAPDLHLSLRVAQLDHQIADTSLRVVSDPALGDYLTELIARCVEHFGLARLRPLIPLAPNQMSQEPWLFAQVPKGSKGPRVRIELPPAAGLVLTRSPDAVELRAEAPLQIVPENTALIADIAVEAVRYRPAAAALELTTHPPAGPLIHELARRLFARFVPGPQLAEALRRLALPAAAPMPPPRLAPAGSLGWEQRFPQIGAVQVALDSARAVDLSLQRRGAQIAFGKGATIRALGLGLNVGVRALDLSFLPWTVELDATPPAGELTQHALSHALRALFAEFMRHFWPTDRSPRAGHDTLLSLGSGESWGPLKICVAPGGSIDVHLDREGLSIRSAAGLFVTGEAIDWLPDFYLHDLSLRAADAAVKLAISGIAEQAYHEAAPVSPVTEAVLSHLYKVLVAPRLPPIWAQRIGLPRPPAPAAPPHDPTRIVVFGARLPGDYGDFEVSMDPTDVITVTASEVEVAVASERGLSARMPTLRLAIQLGGARYHLQTGEVQVGGLGQLENALVEALVRRSMPATLDPSATGVRGLLERFPVDDEGRTKLFEHPLVTVLLQPHTSVRVRLDDAGLRIGSEPALVVDGLARMNYLLCGLRYSFGTARFTLDFEGDSAVADLFEKVVDQRAEKALNDQLLPLLPAAMREPGYRLSTDPRVRDNVAALIRSFTRRKP